MPSQHLTFTPNAPIRLRREVNLTLGRANTSQPQQEPSPCRREQPTNPPTRITYQSLLYKMRSSNAGGKTMQDTTFCCRSAREPGHVASCPTKESLRKECRQPWRRSKACTMSAGELALSASSPRTGDKLQRSLIMTIT